MAKRVKKEEVVVEDSSEVQELVSTLQKKFGKEIISGNNQQGLTFISSGSLSLDIALGGGYPLGRIVEMKGYESSGKTTLALTACGKTQKQTGKAVLYIDREHAIDMDYVEALGVDVSPNKFILSQPGVAEEVFEILREAIKSKVIGCIVVDSVAAMFPKTWLDADVGDSKMGVLARLMSTWLPGLVSDLKKNNILLVFINQYRDKIGVMYGSPKTTPGGKALGFYSSQILDIAKAGVVGERFEEDAIHVRVKVEKNKVAPPLRKAEFDIRFGEGIDRYSELLSIGVDKKVLEKKGGWHYYKGETIGNGAEACREILSEDKKLSDKIEKDILETI